MHLMIGINCFLWTERSKAFRCKMGAAGFILQSVLHLVPLLSTVKLVA